MLGEVRDVDLGERVVLVDTLGRPTMVGYDSLIVAAGASQSYFGNDHFARTCPGHEDDRRRTRAPREDLRRVRDGRARARSGTSARVAHIRGRRRRSDRRRARRADRGALTPRAEVQLPHVRPAERPDRADRRDRHDPRDIPAAASAPRDPRSGAARSRAEARRSGNRSGPLRRGYRDSGIGDRPNRDMDQGLGRRSPGIAARESDRAAGGRDGRSSRTRRGSARLHPCGPSGGIRRSAISWP